LIVGGFLGAFRLIHEFISPSGVINNSLIAMIVEVNHLHFAFILFLISIKIAEFTFRCKAETSDLL
jgi:hypothetical protein